MPKQPKLIDADKLLEYLKEQAEAWRPTQSYYQLKGVIDQVEAGTFDPTPVQPDIPDVKPGDRVNVVKSVQWDFLQDVIVNSIVDNHFGRFANLEYEGKEYTIKIDKLEVIKDGD